MLEIENLQYNGLDGTVDVIIDEQRMERCRIAVDPRTFAMLVIPPQSASAVKWGSHSIADINFIVRRATDNIGNTPA
jgi:hypothetical protein